MMELAFIILLAIIFVGPKRMAETGTTIGRWLNKFVKSDTWIAIKEVWNAISHAPTRMMREANLEDLQKELNLGLDDPLGLGEIHSSAPHRRKPMASSSADNSILPPDRSQIFVDTPPNFASEDSPKKMPARKTATKKSPKVKSSSAKRIKIKSATQKSTKKKRSNA